MFQVMEKTFRHHFHLSDLEPFIYFTINGSFIFSVDGSERHVCSILIRMHYSIGWEQHVLREGFTVELQLGAPGECLIIQIYGLTKNSRRKLNQFI